MAISLSRLQDLLDSNGSLLMQMVLVFYPSFLVPYIVWVMLLFNLVTEKVNHQMRRLRGWIVVVMWQWTMRPLLDPIVEKISNAWEDLTVYLLSTARAVLDPIARTMKNLSQALQTYLANDAAMGHWKAKFIGKYALLFAAQLLQLQCDKTRVIMQCFIFICMHLLTFSYYWSKKLGIRYRRCDCMANSTTNFACFILGIFSQKFYNNSLGNLGAALLMAIFTLSLLVVLRPRTDLGFFGFILGIVGSVTYNRFELTYPTWIIACICFVMLAFKSWLDKHWLDFEEDLPRFFTDFCFPDQQRLSTVTNTSAIMSVFLPHLMPLFKKTPIFESAGVAYDLVTGAFFFIICNSYSFLNADFTRIQLLMQLTGVLFTHEFIKIGWAQLLGAIISELMYRILLALMDPILSKLCN